MSEAPEPVAAYFDANVAAGFGQVVVALGGLLIAVLVCRFLYRRKIFIRV